MKSYWTMLALAGSLALAAPAGAQGRAEKDSPPDVPPAHRPPPGMCRIWLDDVPAGQQPAPTDCKSALKNRPPKARVIFGDDYVDKDRGKEPKGRAMPSRFREPPKVDTSKVQRPIWRRP